MVKLVEIEGSESIDVIVHTGPQGPQGAPGSGGLPSGGNVGETVVNTGSGTGTWGLLSADKTTDGTTNKVFTATEKTKLAGIATAATANSSDAVLLARGNHTGTQAASTISDFDDAVETALGTILVEGSNITLTPGAGTITISSSGGGVGVTDGDKGDITVSSTGTVWTIDNDVVTFAKIQNLSAANTIVGRISSGAGDVEELTAAQVRTIINVANGATANSSDSFLLDRTNHTGTQAQSTVTNLVTDLAAKVGLAGTETITGDKTFSGLLDANGTTTIANLYADGTVRYLFTSLSANTTLGTHNVAYVSASGAARTITLPTAASVAGREYTIIKSDSSSNAVNIVGTSSQTIDGEATISLTKLNQSITVISNGTNWNSVASNNRINAEVQAALDAKVSENAGGFTDIAAVHPGTTITVRKDPTTGYWPASYNSSGVPVYTGGAADSGVRPTSRSDVVVIWKGADPSPAIVSSGTGGMLDNIDVRMVTG